MLAADVPDGCAFWVEEPMGDEVRIYVYRRDVSRDHVLPKLPQYVGALAVETNQGDKVWPRNLYPTWVHEKQPVHVAWVQD